MKRDTGVKKESMNRKSMDLGPLLRKVEKHKRPAFKPVVKDGDGPLQASKFSGAAWLSEKEEWPVCPSCNRPMQLFIQLDLESIPAEIKGEFGQGILQLFYCTGMEPQCEVDATGWEPYSKCSLARVVKPAGKARAPMLPDLEDRFPAKSIVGWEMSDDFPGLEEYELLGIKTDDTKLEEIIERIKTDTWKGPGIGDKLGGYPFWVQGIEYPECRKCGKKMRLLFQLDSEDNLPYMYGDSGVAHITQCPVHKDVVAFGWACY